MKPLFAFFFAFFIPIAISCKSSGAGPASRPPTVDAFVRSYVAALNTRDLAANRKLLHSKSSACITPGSVAFYDRAFSVHARHPIPLDYKSKVTPVGPSDNLGFEGYAVFPVRPTQQVQIDYTKGLENVGTVIFWLAQEDAGWAEVFPCATQETLNDFNAKLPEINAEEAKIRALVD